VCRNTLNRLGRSAEAPLTVLEEGAVLALARMQREGWAYIRA
jgi:intracellular sulfur oxidation DsrE/DsrF family protein